MSSLVSDVSDFKEVRTTSPLTPSQIETYHQDGYLIVPGLFTADELAPLKAVCDDPDALADTRLTVNDLSGRAYHASVWSELGDDYIGVFPRLARLVDAVEALLGEACYHWHSKIVTKRPGDGRVEWHTAYETWYEDGCLYPSLVGISIAIDRNTRPNGCLQVLKKSHLMGRITSVQIGNTCGSDPARVEQALKRHELVYCEMEPGDTLFFHPRMLHASDANESDGSRTMMHCSYNAVSNQPFIKEGQEHHQYKPLIKLPDSTLKDYNYDAVFSKESFHAIEKDDDNNAGIFFRRKFNSADN